MKNFVSTKLTNSITAHITEDDKWRFINYCYAKKDKQSIVIRRLILTLLDEWHQHLIDHKDGTLMYLNDKQYSQYSLNALVKVNICDADFDAFRSYCYINDTDESAVIRTLLVHTLDEFYNNKKINTLK